MCVALLYCVYVCVCVREREKQFCSLHIMLVCVLFYLYTSKFTGKLSVCLRACVSAGFLSCGKLPLL